MAHPSKLTPETHQRIIALVRGGNYVETAAAACGVSKKSIYDWLKRGARAKSGKHRAFAEDFHKAQAESEALALQAIAKAGQGEEVKIIREKLGPNCNVIDRTVETRRQKSWQADAWRLERRFPSRWSRRMRSEHDTDLASHSEDEAMTDKQSARVVKMRLLG